MSSSADRRRCVVTAEEDTKVCDTCENAKPLSAFTMMTAGGPKGNGKQYRYKICRECVNAAAAAKKGPIPPMPSAAEMHDWYQRGCPL